MKPIARKKQKLTLRSMISPLIGLFCVVGLGWLLVKYAQFNQSRTLLPSNVAIGEVNVGDLSVSEAVSRTANTLQQPIILRYQNETIPVTPEMLEFSVNPVILRLQLDQLIDQQRGIGRFPAWLMGNIAPQHLDLPFLYSDASGLKNKQRRKFPSTVTEHISLRFVCQSSFIKIVVSLILSHQTDQRQKSIKITPSKINTKYQIQVNTCTNL